MNKDEFEKIYRRTDSWEDDGGAIQMDITDLGDDGPKHGQICVSKDTGREFIVVDKKIVNGKIGLVGKKDYKSWVIQDYFSLRVRVTTYMFPVDKLDFKDAFFDFVPEDRYTVDGKKIHNPWEK